MNYEKTNLLQTWSEADPFTVERYTQFAKHIDKKSLCILDVGCNTGRGGAMLKSLMPAAKIYGLDVVEERVGKVPENIYEKIIYKSLMDLEHEYDGLFDNVVAGEVVEHIAPDEIKKFLDTIYRILSPGGTILLTTPNPDSILVKLGRTDVYNDPSHLSIMKSSVLEEKIAQAKFKNIKILGSGKATRYLPEKFPFLLPFGSYLIKANK
ncbi:MAG: class I SAM-dependent methyltransferase [Chitinophagaceae bacterium]